MFLWTDERVQALKEMLVEGLSASQIAARIGGITRSAVIGKSYRLRISTAMQSRKGRPLTSKAQRKVITKRSVRKDKSIQKAIAAGKTINWRDSVPFAEPPVQAVARVSFDELEPGHCRFPVGTVGDAGFGFCGQPQVLGKVYCAACCRVAYPSPAPRKPQPNYVVVPTFALADA